MATEPETTARPLSGRVALVTGASGDIGGATALALAAQGATVGLNYFTSEEGARSVLGRIEHAGGRALLVHGDVGRSSDVRRMVEQLRAEAGPVTLLVNNSGGGAEHNQVQSMSDAEWDRTLATNLTGAFLCTRAVVPGMLELGRGRIVNVSSICGITGDCDPAYCASKAGLLGLTRSCAARLAPTIQVNAVLPGFVGTKYHAARREGVKAAVPDGHLADPTEIAELIVFLIGMKSSFVTGACIPIDGGATVASLGMHLGWIRGETEG
jgi:3-oxoacyl-[acyl-carrier protein] reductase